MSDWELVPSDSQKQDMKPPQNNSDWEVVPVEPNSRQPQAESLGAAALKAPGRIGEDLYRGGMNFIQNLPGYYEKAKTEVPGLVNLIEEHPVHAAGQGLAGFGEMLQGLAGLPHGIASYGANRLNLIPQSFAEKVPYPKDRTEQINQLLGEPKYPGEALIRGTARNAAGILGGGKLANMLNPANLTVRSIAKDIVNTEKKQVASHSKTYNKIWDEARKTDFNEIPVNKNILGRYEKLLKNHKTPKEFESLTDLIKNPTLENAQQAQSQMNRISRTLYEKSKKGALDKWENKLYDAALKAEKHIEENMFKNKKGEVNKKLQNQYNKVTKKSQIK